MAAITVAVRDELDDRPGDTEMVAEAEIRAALTWTRRLAEGELSFALDIQQRLPRLFRLLEAGRVDVRKAKVILDGTIHLDGETARKVVDRILDDAPGLTTGQIRARLWTSDGLPVGSHLLGRFGDEETLLSLAAQLERAQPWFDRTPPPLDKR